MPLNQPSVNNPKDSNSTSHNVAHNVISSKTTIEMKQDKDVKT
jgi:hypothetical protein